MSKGNGETVVDDSKLERVIQAICPSTRTGQISDGKVFVLALEQVIRIGTGKTGKEAI